MPSYYSDKLKLIFVTLYQAKSLTKEGLGKINFTVEEVDDDEIEEEGVFDD